MKSLTVLVRPTLAIWSWFKQKMSWRQEAAPATPPAIDDQVKSPVVNHAGEVSKTPACCVHQDFGKKRSYSVLYEAADGTCRVEISQRRVRTGSTMRDEEAKCYTAMAVKRIRPCKGVEWSGGGQLSILGTNPRMGYQDVEPMVSEGVS